MTQPYRATAQSLETLHDELVEKAANIQRRAEGLTIEAEILGIPVNKELTNRLLDIAETYRIKAGQVDAAARVCYDVGTAAETVSPGGIGELP